MLEHGTGGLNIDGCRVGESKRVPGSPKSAAASQHTVSLPGYVGGSGHDPNVGRFPANLILDPEAGARLDGEVSGGPSRFFYCAKASVADREEGMEHLPKSAPGEMVDREPGSPGAESPRAGAGRKIGGRANIHPTVKPTELMRYLCRLITPPGGLILDPFCGSGSTGKAAVLEGFRFFGCEMDPKYVEIARARIAWAEANRG